MFIIRTQAPRTSSPIDVIASRILSSGQQGASGEGTLADPDDRVRDVHRGKRAASGEGIVADRCDRLRDVHRGERAASVEGTVNLADRDD